VATSAQTTIAAIGATVTPSTIHVDPRVPD